MRRDMALPLALLIAASAIAACQSADALTAAPTPVTLSGPAAGAIAGDITSRLAEQVPSAATPLLVKPDQGDFAVALSAALKGWGYHVTTAASPDAKPMRLDYALYDVDGQVFAQLDTPSIVVSRAYVASATGAAPASPLSIMQRN